MKNKDVRGIGLPVTLIIACFALGIADMMLLRSSISTLMGLDVTMSSIMALVIATVANFSAFLWGKEAGENSFDPAQAKKASRSSFLAWVALGVFYMIIRIAEMFTSWGEDGDLTALIGDLVNMGLLAVLYIGTGTTISQAAKTIFDYGGRLCRLAKAEFEKYHKKMPRNVKMIVSNLKVLQKYDKNYDYLDAQVQDTREMISKYELATLADVEAKILSQHIEIDPVDLDKILKDVRQTVN